MNKLQSKLGLIVKHKINDWKKVESFVHNEKYYGVYKDYTFTVTFGWFFWKLRVTKGEQSAEYVFNENSFLHHSTYHSVKRWVDAKKENERCDKSKKQANFIDSLYLLVKD